MLKNRNLKIINDYSLLFSANEILHTTYSKGLLSSNLREKSVFQILKDNKLADNKYCFLVIFAVQNLIGKDAEWYDKSGKKIKIPILYEDFLKVLDKIGQAKISFMYGGEESKTRIYLTTGVISGTLVLDSSAFHPEDFSLGKVMKSLKLNINQAMICYGIKVKIPNIPLNTKQYKKGIKENG